MIFNKGLLAASVAAMLIFSSCQTEDNNEMSGSVSIEITDAPIDNANVSGAFVTITDIKVDGNSVDGFNKTTIDLLAYQNGDVKSLMNYNADASAYSDIVLVLDFDQDATGNAPGCYVREVDGTKHKLVSTSNEVTVDYTFSVLPQQRTDLVIDFDLRKSIIAEQNGSDNYEFVSQTEMNNAVRVVTKNQTGVIEGNCADQVSGSDKVVVYAYKKGTYSRDSEVQGQGQSSIEFSNAVTSANVDASGNFELHFLEEGQYEVYFASYNENATSGEMELQGTLDLNVMSAIDILAISIGANASITLNVVVTGVVPI